MTVLFAAAILAGQATPDTYLETVPQWAQMIVWDPASKTVVGTYIDSKEARETEIWELSGPVPKLRKKIEGHQVFICSGDASRLAKMELPNLLKAREGVDPYWDKAQALIYKLGFRTVRTTSLSGPVDGEFLAICAATDTPPSRTLDYRGGKVGWMARKPDRYSLTLVDFDARRQTARVVCGIVFNPEPKSIYPRDRISVRASTLAFDPVSRLAYLNFCGRVVRLMIM